MLKHSLCIFSLGFIVGCNQGPAPVAAPDRDPDGFADAVVAKLDGNSDGSLDKADDDLARRSPPGPSTQGHLRDRRSAQQFCLTAHRHTPETIRHPSPMERRRSAKHRVVQFRLAALADMAHARPYPVQEAWPIGFGSGKITKVEWLPAPQTVNRLADETAVEDPLDLKEMGRQALEQMLVTLLPDRMGYRPSQWGDAMSFPSLGWHQEYSEVAEQAGRAGTAFCLLRQAFGFAEGLDKERGMYRVTAHHVKFGLPTQPLPDQFTEFRKEQAKLEDPDSMARVEKRTAPTATDEADLPCFVDFGFAVPLVVETWIMRYEMTKDSGLKKMIEEAIAAMRRNAVIDPTGFAYYPTRGVGLDEQGKAPWGGAYPNAGGGNLLPLAHWGELTGDSELMEFVRSLADGILAGVAYPLDSEPLKFGRVRWDGSFEMDVSRSSWAWPGSKIPKIANPVLDEGMSESEETPQVHWGMAHTLSHTTVVWGMAYAGMVTGESRYLDWAKKIYNHLLSIGNDSGWFQEHLPWPYPVLKDPRQHTETCITADMMDIASFFARAGDTDYWDHVERYARNYLAVMQMHFTPEFEAFYRRTHKDRPAAEVEEALKELKQRLEGGHAASCLLNDMATGLEEEGPHVDVMGCCAWSGARAIGRAGVSVMTEKEGATWVNLSINHDTSQARVVSFLPSSGRMTVVIKKPGRFYLRPAAWAPRSQVRAYRNAKSVPVFWKDNYVQFDGGVAGEELTITYPLPHFLQDVSIAGRNTVDRYTVEWLGNTVVGISPKGKGLPLYHNRQGILTTAGATSLLEQQQE